MKWFLFWAVAATANGVSQPTIFFDTKAECQRSAAQWHADQAGSQRTGTITALALRRHKGEQSGESPAHLADALDKMSKGLAYASVLFAREYTLICKEQAV